METLRQVAGTLLAIDLLSGVALLGLVCLLRRRGQTRQQPGSAGDLAAAFGCFSVAVVLLYAGIWLLTRG